jgi:hypothetical protein
LGPEDPPVAVVELVDEVEPAAAELVAVALVDEPDGDDEVVELLLPQAASARAAKTASASATGRVRGAVDIEAQP